MVRTTAVRVAVAAAVVIAVLVVFAKLAEPEHLYEVASSELSPSGEARLTIGLLNPYPLSRECYRYVFVHPADAELNLKELQWDFLVAMVWCDGELSARWEGSDAVAIITKAIVVNEATKLHDSSGKVQIRMVTDT